MASSLPSIPQYHPAVRTCTSTKNTPEPNLTALHDTNLNADHDPARHTTSDTIDTRRRLGPSVDNDVRNKRSQCSQLQHFFDTQDSKTVVHCVCAGHCVPGFDNENCFTSRLKRGTGARTLLRISTTERGACMHLALSPDPGASARVHGRRRKFDFNRIL